LIRLSRRETDRLQHQLNAFRIDSEYRRLKALGVSFRGEPKSMGPIIAVLFEDTCGNLINLVQPTA